MECIFCKIAKKELESEIVYEDENFLAFLDIHPRSRGMTLVIPKRHVKNLGENEEISKRLFLVTIKVAEAIKKGLSPIAISIAYLPSQIEHLHLRIYPYFENEIPLIENKPIEISVEELKRVGEEIRKHIVLESLEEFKVEENKEKVKNGEEAFWAKRDWMIA